VKKRSKIEARHSDKAPTMIADVAHLIITTPSGQGFAIDIERDTIKVRIDGIEFMTVEPQGANMVTIRRRRR
jgi:hypothetical protein